MEDLKLTLTAKNKLKRLIKLNKIELSFQEVENFLIPIIIEISDIDQKQFTKELNIWYKKNIWNLKSIIKVDAEIAA